MVAVYLCPAADLDAQQHYEDTVVVPVDFELEPTTWLEAFDPLRAAHPAGSAPMWGSRPGAGGRHRAKHGLMTKGDIVLFYADKRFFAAATIAVPFVNEAKARDLWGSDSSGETWELMFSLSDLATIDLPVTAFNSAVGYKSNNYVQGFDRLDGQKAAVTLDLLDLDVPVSTPDPEELKRALALLVGPLDKQVTAAVRVEQRFLRLALQGGKQKPMDSCALCGREFPTAMLVAAHIKQRSMCTDDERRDIPAVAMFACTFGCDALFERGYIAVDSNGAIIRSMTKPMASDLTGHLEGLYCLAYNAERSSYFEWHRETQFS